MRRRWLRTNTLMLMALVACCAALLGVLKNQYDASPLHAALRGLRSSDASVRLEAVRALATFQSEPDAAVPALIATLRDPDEAVRSQAIFALTYFGPRAASAVAELEVVLREDRQVGIRRVAIDALGWIGSPEAVSHLIEILEDEDPTIRRQAALSLNRLGLKASTAIPHLIGRLERDRSEDVRLGCLEALIVIGRVSAMDGDSVARARANALLRDASDEVRARAASSKFGDLRPSEIEIPALIAALDDPISRVGEAAAQSLARVGLGDPRVVPALCRAIRASREPREVAHWAEWLNIGANMDLSALDATAIRSALGAILSLLELRDVEVRRAAIIPLISIGQMERRTKDPAWSGAAETASRTLLAMLEDPREDSRVRVEILDGSFMEGFECDIGFQLAVLKEAIPSKDPAVQTRAVLLLVYRILRESEPSRRGSWLEMVPALMVVLKDRGMGPEPDSWARGLWRGMVPVLTKALEDPARDVRLGAARVLDELGMEARPAGDVLRKLANNDPDADIRRFAAHAVESIDTPARLKDARPEVRRAAATALGRMGWRSAPAVPDLIVVLDDADASVRVAVIESLGRIGPDAGAAVQALRRLAADGPDAAIRGAAERTLKAIFDARGDREMMGEPAN
jgi:HEAT repeat protein